MNLRHRITPFLSLKCSLSPSQQGNLVSINGSPEPEQRDDNGEPDSDFRCRQRHREEDDDLTVKVVVGFGESDKGDVSSVEHQLNAHEHDDDVALYEHPESAEAEQDRTQRQNPIKRNSCLQT